MTKGNFPTCLAFTLKQEGGFSDDPADPGGHTMRGIIQKTYDAWRARQALPPTDVAQITSAEAEAIYRSAYWDAIKADDLAPGVDLCSFDYAVNSGPQKALAELAKATLGNPPAERIINTISSDRLSFLHALGAWSRFGAGWGKRVAACEALALVLANASLAPAAVKAKEKQDECHAKIVGTAAVGVSGAVAVYQSSVSLWGVGILAAFAVAVVVLNAFMAWRQGQRRDALEAGLADMAAKKRALDASRLAETALKAAVEANIAKQRQQIKTAEQAEAALTDSAPVSASPVESSSAAPEGF